MHKLYLTDPECEIIENAEEFIGDLGGFPSMENAQLLDISISTTIEGWNQRYIISLIYDLEKWLLCAGNYGIKPKPKYRKIKLHFDGITRFSFQHNFMAPGGGDIYFNNKDGTIWDRASLPEIPFVRQRPFCMFYANSKYCLYFNENDCIVRAEYVEDSDK